MCKLWHFVILFMWKKKQQSIIQGTYFAVEPLSLVHLFDKEKEKYHISNLNMYILSYYTVW